MPPLLLALVLLGALALVLAWALRANPRSIGRWLRGGALVLLAIGLGVVVLFGVRFLPSLLPEILGLAGVLLAAAVARAVRQRGTPGFSSAGSAQRTEVRTAFLQAWVDHGSGEVGGSVLAGRFAGRSLDALAETELVDLHGECASDPDSLKVLEAYLDRRLPPGWRQSNRGPRATPRGDMTREEALAVLGLQAGATAEEIRAAHRRLIQRVHPDVGGSADLAARINRAKDVLLGT